MPERELPDPPERGSLRWRVLARRKFVWEAGDIRLVHQAKDREEAPRRPPDGAREDDGSADEGRG